MLMYVIHRHTFRGVPVLLCFWHVKRSWLKQVVRKAKKATRKGMFQALSNIMLMHNNHLEPDLAFDVRVVTALEAFYALYPDETSFVAYVRRWWRGMFQGLSCLSS
jgi:hypothetical protein